MLLLQEHKHSYPGSCFGTRGEQSEISHIVSTASRLITYLPLRSAVPGAKRIRSVVTAVLIFYGTEPTRPIGDWKEAWEKAKERAAAIF